MTTITFKNEIELDRNEVGNLEDFQNYLAINVRLQPYHERILDGRILNANENPEDYISFQELKDSL